MAIAAAWPSFLSRGGRSDKNSSKIEEQIASWYSEIRRMIEPFLTLSFSDLLSQTQGGRAASWLVAIVGVAGYTYWTNRDNGQTFTKEEQSKWNAGKDKK